MKQTYCDVCGEEIKHKDKAMIDGKGYLDVKITKTQTTRFYVVAQKEHIQDRVMTDDQPDLCEVHFKGAVRGEV